MNDKSLDNKTKADKLRAALKCGEIISPIDSFNRFGLHSCSQAVTRFRREGMKIISIPVEGQRWVRYRCVDGGT